MLPVYTFLYIMANSVKYRVFYFWVNASLFLILSSGLYQFVYPLIISFQNMLFLIKIRLQSILFSMTDLYSSEIIHHLAYWIFSQDFISFLVNQKSGPFMPIFCIRIVYCSTTVYGIFQDKQMIFLKNYIDLIDFSYPCPQT